MSDVIQDFASFHNHSHYSFFDGLSLPQELLQAAKDKGLKSIALTDHGVTHGHADWYLLGKKMGVRAVFGVEAYVIHSIAEWKEQKAKLGAQKKGGGQEFSDDGDVVDAKSLRRKGHLVILATDREGLANLYRLVYLAHKEGFYGKPRMDKEMLREHAKGLVATSACMGGVISKRLWDMKEGAATWDDVKREVLEYDAVFGRGRFFLELQFNEMDAEQNFINESMVRLSEETGVPTTVTTDAHYSRADEWEPRELLHMLGWSKKTVADMPGGVLDPKIKQLYVKGPDEMWRSYKNFASHRVSEAAALKAFQGPLLIDSLVTDFEPDVHQRLPALPYANPFKEMGERAIAGLRRLGLADRDEYKARLLRELGVIRDKGISNYFLITQRYLDEAKEIMEVGPGRGSSAGSLVCYALGITDLDPLRHGLLFERFLDPDRAEMPDIDSDFEDPAAAKDLMKKVFGEDNVASLSNYGTFQIKSLLKDLGRVYGVDHNEVNRLNKRIEAELRVLYVDQDKSTIVIKLDDIERVSPTFRAFCEQQPDLARQVKKLYGRIRQAGRHASGVIIGDDLPRETSIFVVRDKETEERIVQTSFTEGIVNKNLSAMGFIKFDVLGLASLRVLHHAWDLVAKKLGVPYAEVRESCRASKLDLDDPKVMKHVFWDGRFAGIFQFSEKGIRKLAQRLRPDSFVDVSAVVSLYRPGPLKGGYHDTYVRAKHGGAVTFDHPLLEEVMGSTNGCLVFQEQIMQVCGKLGKMAGKDVNRVRKVLLKKDKSKSEEFLKKENDELFAKFLAGCRENDFPEDKALKLWEDIKAFGGYAFNKSHSDAYSVVTMQTAHLATYHPLEFYAAVLTKAQAGKVQDVVSDIRSSGVKLLPIDVNLSKMDHRIEEGRIRLAFSSALGVGPAAIAKIVAGQPYADFTDFLDRSGAPSGAVKPLLRAGAFSSLPGCSNMRRLEAAYEEWLPHEDSVANYKLRKNRDAWLERFAQLTEDWDAPDYDLAAKVGFENDLLGFSLAGTPFEILDRREKIDALFGDALPTYDSFTQADPDDGLVSAIPVVVKDVRARPDRRGQQMAFVKFADETGKDFEAVAFSSVWKHVGHRLKPRGVYVVTFNKQEDDPEALKIGKPGFAHSPHSAASYVVDVDEIQL